MFFFFSVKVRVLDVVGLRVSAVVVFNDTQRRVNPLVRNRIQHIVRDSLAIADKLLCLVLCILFLVVLTAKQTHDSPLLLILRNHH